MLTDKAEALNQRIKEKIFETEEKMLEGITDDQIETVKMLIGKMIDNISD